MGKRLALIGVIALALTGCSEPREHSAVEVTPPPVIEVPTQTVFYDALTTHLPEDAIISAGVPAIESLNTASAELGQYDPVPAQCATTIDPEYYTTTEVALGFHTQTADDTHTTQTVVAAGFDTADDAAAYFSARTQPWTDCDTVDLTIDETNVLTLHYDTTAFADTEDIEVPRQLAEADQDLIVTTAGELSGALQRDEATLPDPGSLPDYIVSPDDVPEPEAENIQVSNATVVARFDTDVFWITVEPSQQLEQAIETLADIVETVHAES